jgi:hypothetical protein
MKSIILFLSLLPAGLAVPANADPGPRQGFFASCLALKNVARVASCVERRSKRLPDQTARLILDACPRVGDDFHGKRDACLAAIAPFFVYSHPTDPAEADRFRAALSTYACTVGQQNAPYTYAARVRCFENSMLHIEWAPAVLTLHHACDGEQGIFAKDLAGSDPVFRSHCYEKGLEYLSKYPTPAPGSPDDDRYRAGLLLSACTAHQGTFGYRRHEWVAKRGKCFAKGIRGKGARDEGVRRLSEVLEICLENEATWTPEMNEKYVAMAGMDPTHYSHDFGLWYKAGRCIEPFLEQYLKVGTFAPQP